MAKKNMWYYLQVIYPREILDKQNRIEEWNKLYFRSFWQQMTLAQG